MSQTVAADPPSADIRSMAWWRRLGRRHALMALPPVAFVAFAFPMSILTPAWNNNDEPSHVAYVEYVLAHHGFPAIGIQNLIESHQPPLYYLFGALWQRIAGVRPFSITTLVPTAAMHADGWDVHWLRLMSIGFGLSVVIAAMVAARLLFASAGVSVFAGLIVGLWPKFLIVATSVSNDVLVDACCAWFFVGVLVLVRRPDWVLRRDWLIAAATGLAGGCAILSKFTAIPMVLLGLLVLVVRMLVAHRSWHGVVAVATVVATAAATCTWWFVRNQSHYGDVLARRATEQYLKIPFHGGLVAHLSFVNEPSLFVHRRWPMLRRSLLYDGGWNQYALPHWLDTLFWWVLLTLAVIVIAVLVRTRQWRRPGMLTTLALAVAGPIAWVQIAQETTQGEGRYLFVSIVPIAMLLLVPVAAIVPRGARFVALAAWPVVFVAVDLYVFAEFILPNTRSF